ncbi:hypothetical protein [Kocuria palustris]|uniref:hypothetical protein n=1 Tax=Kocuria palustris TaxID=71999 RepID=UPI00119F59CC|nr:hypothetical protein [Kocuria palustris]
MSIAKQERTSSGRGGRPGARDRAPELRRLRWQRPLAAAVALNLAVVALSLLMPIVLGLAWDDWQHPVRRWFDVGSEGNLPTWWNTALLIAAAVLGAGVAVLHRSTGASGWPAWSALAALAALLSLDEAAGLHERLRFLADAIAPRHGFTYAWLAVGIPLGIAVLAAAILLGRRIGPTSRRLFVLGLAVLLAGAVGLETANDLLVSARGGELPAGGSPAFHVVYHLEELLELLGSSLLMAAPLASLRIGASGGRIVLRTR